MTAPQSSQLSGFALISNPVAAGLKSSQFASIIVQQDAPAYSPQQSSQMALIVVASNNKNVLSLGPVIKLPCWQPCTAYGTRSIVIRFR